MMLLRSIGCVLVLMVGGLVSCGGPSSVEQAANLTVLRVAVLPDETAEVVSQKYTPLLDVVSDYIGLPYELLKVPGYEELVAVMARGEADIAHFGAYSYVLAREQANVVALVQRDVDTRFTSYLVARADEEFQGLSSFEGSVIRFGSRLSTSGHLMPRQFLEESGFSPEDFFAEVTYSGAHDETVLSVVDGEADLGAVNAQIYENMLADGRVSPDLVRVVAETPPYTNYVWAVHPSVPESLRIDIRDAFMSISPTVEPHLAILESFGARVFLPASDSDYAEIRRAVQAVGGV